LEIEVTAERDAVVVSWPVSPVPYELQSVPLLELATTPWAVVEPAPVLLDDVYVFTNAITNPRLFRLVRP
jgi:hypothetical protein